jgi:hypothetical protein
MAGNRPARGSDGRLREVILLVLAAALGEATRDRIAHACYLIDLEAYLSLGRSITGKAYVKKAHGPEPRRLGHVLAAMRRNGEVA